MTTINLSKRLTKVSEFIRKNDTVADIGSDHAYLPIYLVNQGISQQIIAGEVVEGPYNSAVQHVQSNGMSQQIKVRLGSGLLILKPAEDQVDTIVIAGMGGNLICDILQNGYTHLNGQERLILQANIGEDKVRNWLMNHQYSIIDESILKEDGHIYEIIVADPLKDQQDIRYTNEQLKFGPYLMQRKTSAFKEKWQAILRRRQKLLQQLQNAKITPVDKLKAVELEIQKIEEIIHD